MTKTDLLNYFGQWLVNDDIPIAFNQEELLRWFVRERGPIFYLMFGITYECQLKCKHCCTGNYIKEKNRELTTKEIKDVLDQASKPLVVNFFGGEPTLRPDLMELINYASKKAMFIFLDTNGINITKNFACFVSGALVSWFGFGIARN